MEKRITNWFRLKFLKNKKSVDKVQDVIHNNVESKTEKEKTIGALTIFDDVFVKINDKTYNGWVTGKTEDEISICYDKVKDGKTEVEEAIFQISDIDSNATTIVIHNRMLILNKKDI